MKFRRGKDILRFSGIAVLLTLAGILMMSFLSGPTYFGIGFVLIIMGVIAIIIAIIIAARPKEDLIQDERSVRVDEKAGYHAFWMVLLSITILFWSDRVWSIGVELVDMYYAAMFVGIISWSVLRWHYSRKGDVV